MESLDVDGRSLEEVVEELIDIYYPVSEEKASLIEQNRFLQQHDDEAFIARVLVQRLKGELCKYLSRSVKYARQIRYIKGKIRDLEDKYPEIKVNS
jgi:hypothetical protein